jgi:hypothetical protein
MEKPRSAVEKKGYHPMTPSTIGKWDHREPLKAEICLRKKPAKHYDLNDRFRDSKNRELE